jgi:penicillin-insensitive murein endopeptidase
VKEIVTAPEARVQWIFMYEPIAAKLIEHATRIGEPEAVIARARQTLKQPGDSARHDDHLHVRVYCTDRDRQFGCIDIGPMEIYAERAAEEARGSDLTKLIATIIGGVARAGGSETVAAATTMASSAADPGSLRRLLRIDASLRLGR